MNLFPVAEASMACVDEHQPQPYLVRSTGPGTADVVDRATGERVGWLRRTFDGWEGHASSPWRRVTPHERYRGEAAGAVWQATRGAK